MMRPPYLRAVGGLTRRLRLTPSPPCQAYSYLARTRFNARTTNVQLRPTQFLLSHPATRSPIRLFSLSSAQYDSNITIRVPPMAESITEGTIGQFNKAVGDFIEADEELASIETDKIDVAVNAPQSGIIRELLVAEGDTVSVDQEIAEIEPGSGPGEQSDAKKEVKDTEAPKKDEVSEASEKESPKEKDTSTAPASQQSTSPSPMAQSKTTQPNASAQSATPSGASVEIHEGPGYSRPSRAEELVKMTRIRQTTAKRLKESQNTAAFLTTFNEVDMSRLMNFREKNKEGVLEKYGVKLGFMGPMARASALALKEIPAVNASIENNDRIVYRDYVDLSVAAATPKGLVTPILRNIEVKSIVEIEKGIAELVKRARNNKLTMDDLTGGTFTISNSGIWGSLFGTPIINLPQTAVLGTYGIQDRPVAIDGHVEIRPMMYIALTYDHRIIDGREAVIFLTLIKKYLEDPETMLVG